MEKPIKVFNHQKIHAGYGRIKAVDKARLRNPRLDGVKRWYTKIGGVKQTV